MERIIDFKKFTHKLVAIAYDIRLETLLFLEDGEKSVGEILSHLLKKGYVSSQGNLSQHLKLLRQEGLVEDNRRGNFVEYRLKNPQIIEAINKLMRVLD